MSRSTVSRGHVGQIQLRSPLQLLSQIRLRVESGSISIDGNITDNIKKANNVQQENCRTRNVIFGSTIINWIFSQMTFQFFCEILGQFFSGKFPNLTTIVVRSRRINFAILVTIELLIWHSQLLFQHHQKEQCEENLTKLCYLHAHFSVTYV